MSHYDYIASQEIAAQSYPFYALIMAAIRQADTRNITLLQSAFPETFAEFLERYDTPGGFIANEARLLT